MLQRKRLSKKNDWRRRLRSLGRHGALLGRQTAFAVGVTLVWYFAIYSSMLPFVPRIPGRIPEEDRDLFATAVLVVLIMPFAILGGETLRVVWDQYRRVMRAVIEKDQHTFMLLRDERISTSIYLLLGVLAVLISVIVYFFDYSNGFFGCLAVFSVTLSLTLFWAVLVLLGDPTKSVWLRERVPPVWLTQDTDEFFKLGPNYVGEGVPAE